jgi:hypothetical protein
LTEADRKDIKDYTTTEPRATKKSVARGPKKASKASASSAEACGEAEAVEIAEVVDIFCGTRFAGKLGSPGVLQSLGKSEKN